MFIVNIAIVANRPYITVFKFAVIVFITLAARISSIAQSCPSNIDFEQGNYTNWTCLTGYVTANGTQNEITLSPSGGPVPGQHTMFSRATSLGINDSYGGFPVICPNGSGYSIKLGNSSGGHEAEGVKYTFTIPANRNTYSLVYYYAVVFENPNHQIYQQPRMEIEVKNETDNNIIDCSSFTFIPFGSSLPGFFTSPIADSVLCKDWTPVTINLNGRAGKTVSLTFKTADCTFNRHFGYAYIDVNTGCSGELTGAAYCPDDTAVNVVAPFGFAIYNWYNQNFSALLGTTQTLTLKPPPLPGTTLAVEVTPYAGFGCIDTLYAVMKDTLKLQADAGNNALLCGAASTALLGVAPVPGAVYQWMPVTWLDNPAASNPAATPPVTTQYILNMRNGGGGCSSYDTVNIVKSLVDTALQFIGKKEFCITSSDSAVFFVNPSNSIQWYYNNSAVSGATNTKYKATKPGTYYARITNSDGCTADTRKETVNIETPAQGVTYPIQYTVVNLPVQLTARDFKGTQLWQPPIYLNDASLLSPLFTSPVVTEQLYAITIISKAGCTINDRQLVKVIKEVKVYVPNAFTPNNDGLNDYLYPITFGASVGTFKVFNRWGQMVFSIAQNEKGWDGTYNGLQQEPGTYVWYYEGQGVDRKKHYQKGTVILIR